MIKLLILVLVSFNANARFNLFEDSLVGNVTFAALDGLGFFETANSSNCQRSLFLVVNQANMLGKNITLSHKSPFAQLGPWLNLTNFVSDSISNTALFCPKAFYDYACHLGDHYRQFKGNDFKETAESIAFSLFASSIDIRSAIVNLGDAVNNNDIAGIVFEAVSTTKKLVLVENVYKSPAFVESDLTENFKVNETQDDEVWKKEFDSSGYKLPFETFYRFADFFQRHSFVNTCSENLKVQEDAILRLVSGKSWEFYEGKGMFKKSLKVAGFSHHLQQFLGLFHSTFQNCSYALVTELADKHVYLDFSSNLITSIGQLLAQDEKVYFNVLQLLALFGVSNRQKELPESVAFYEVEKESAGKNFRQIGWFLGDIIARLVLNQNE